jgi:PleD family two-component response regulator
MPAIYEPILLSCSKCPLKDSQKKTDIISGYPEVYGGVAYGCRSTTILIVDDEEAALNICKHLLRKMGYNVIEANNSSDA